MSHSPCIAIVGAGPAACTLAALLARRGLRPLVFDNGRRPGLLVGESLIPAVVPLLRRLGIEGEVAAIARHKPGVSFLHEKAAPIHFNFAPIARHLPTYAYNVDRQSFDALLKSRAQAMGARFVPVTAGVSRAPAGSGRDVELDAATLAATPQLGGRQPDLLVDATGRRRAFSSLLGIPAHRGNRDDMAIFAHYEGFPETEPSGQVLISRMSRGWSWRIPLPGGIMSFGIVVDKATASAWGASAEDRLERGLHGEAIHGLAGHAAPRRVRGPVVYSNYQMIGERSFGPGWALAGDAFGFVDPMLSSGLFLAMESAAKLDDAIGKWEAGAVAGGEGFRRAMRGYDATMRGWYVAWSSLIDKFYDGRIFALHEAGCQMREKRSNRIQHALDRRIMKHIACMASGATTASRGGNAWLSALCRCFAIGVLPPDAYAIQA